MCNQTIKKKYNGLCPLHRHLHLINPPFNHFYSVIEAYISGLSQLEAQGRTKKLKLIVEPE